MVTINTILIDYSFSLGISQESKNIL